MRLPNNDRKIKNLAISLHITFQLRSFKQNFCLFQAKTQWLWNHNSITLRLGLSMVKSLIIASFFFCSLLSIAYAIAPRYMILSNQNKWVKVFKNGKSKICGRQPSKILRRYDLSKQTISLKIFKRLSTNFTWSILEYLDSK